MSAAIDSKSFKPIISVNYEHKKTDQLVIIGILWATLTTMFFINRPYYSKLIFTGESWRLLLLPLSLYGLVWQFLLITAIYSTVVYKILAWIEPPKQGIFSIPGREFRFYCLRFWVSYYLIYVARAMPVPWIDMLVFPIFGSKAGKNVVLYDSWIDPEFVSIGNYCMLSLNTQIFSHGIVGQKFIVKKVVMEKNSIAGGGSIVAPGTYFEEGAILGGSCTTIMDQRLEGHRIHVGTPACKSLPIKTYNPKQEEYD